MSLPAIAQRRQMNRKHIQPVVKIAAERADGHHLVQIGIGGGDQPELHGDRSGAAEAAEAALFDHLEQFDLQIGSGISPISSRKNVPATRLQTDRVCAAWHR